MIQYRGDSYPDWADEREGEGHFRAREAAEKEIADEVNHPSHYKHGKFETIEIIEELNLGYNLGNAFKYISRAGKKDANKHIQDLEKAVWYINREIGQLNLKFERDQKIEQENRQDDWSL